MLLVDCFDNCFYLKRNEEFYFLQLRDTSIITGLPESNKGWKPLLIRMTDPIRFGVDLRWREAKAGGNQVPSLYGWSK